MNNVREAPLVDGRPVGAGAHYGMRSIERPKAAPKRRATWALGLTLIAFGGIGWIFGGSFTLDGWISWMNSVLAIVRLPLAIPQAQGLWRLLFIPLAFVYSRVETRHRPVWRDAQGRWHFETPIFWVGFLLITLTDIGSTAVGLQATDPAAWGVLAPTVSWIVASGGRVGSVATILTFAPEWLILSGMWLLKR